MNGEKSVTSGSGAYKIDQQRKEIVTPNGKRVRLPPCLFDLMDFLHANRGRVFTYQEIAAFAWGSSHFGKELVATQIANIRRRVGRDAIDTVRLHGYGVGIRQ